MKKSYVLILLLLVMIASPRFVFGASPTANTTSKESPIDTKIENTVSSFLPRTKQFIIDHTPEFIKKSVVQAVQVTEEFRQDLADKLEIKKTSIQGEESSLETTSSTQASWQDKSTPLLKKVELFLTTICATIFESKILFYGFASLVVIMLVRIVGKKLL